MSFYLLDKIGKPSLNVRERLAVVFVIGVVQRSRPAD